MTATRAALVIRGVLVATLCATVAACGSSDTGDGSSSSGQRPAEGELSPQFLDMLAPVDGDSGARAGESSRVLLAQAEADAITSCMKHAGFAEYAQLPVLNTRDLLGGHPEFVSPAKLESRGLVAAADPRLEEVPAAAQSALGACLGEDGARSVSRATDRFVVYRDGLENPFSKWFETLRTEVAHIAESDAPETQSYRECFRQLGIPADVARDGGEAADWLIAEMNDRTTAISRSQIDAWQRGDGFLDADGGALAGKAAECFRKFEALLTPRLRDLRDAVVDDKREQLLDGQRLFYEAIGTRGFDPGGYDF